jgi:hypothetical protein
MIHHTPTGGLPPFFLPQEISTGCARAEDAHPESAHGDSSELRLMQPISA